LTVQLQEWHPTISRWLDVTNRRLAGTTTQTTFAGLASHRGFRMRVWFGNSIGWSLPSLWTSEAVTR
jgi:hypothetical protein